MDHKKLLIGFLKMKENKDLLLIQHKNIYLLQIIMDGLKKLHFKHIYSNIYIDYSIRRSNTLLKNVSPFISSFSFSLIYYSNIEYENNVSLLRISIHLLPGHF